MKFITMVTSAAGSRDGVPPPAFLQALGAFGKSAAEAGVLVEQAGLRSIDDGGFITLADGELNFIDGPYTEAKELVGGYAVFDVPSKEDAVSWGRRFMELHQQHWNGWEGHLEIRQIV